MLEKGKVSIVVPIYNVEKYIHKCVDSILQQTYTHLEVILVNDGSPDNCGEIAEDYQKKDRRVKVIHKSNGGLSDARNVGMKHITGEYTVFVDSDDWLDENMIEMMVNSMQLFKADIVQSAFYYAYDDKLLVDNRHFQDSDSPVLLDNQTLMYELVKNDKVKNFAWGKLYQTKLIKDIPFKTGVLFEDVFWAHQVMHQVDSYLILHEPLFYYYQRDDSIVATYSLRNLDVIKGLQERHTFIEQFYKELTGESYKIILKTCLIHYNLLIIHGKKDKDGIRRKEIENYIKKNSHSLRNAVKSDAVLRKQLFLFRLHPYVNIVYLGLRKILRKMRILSQPKGLEQVNI
jgi:glycosyltransferase involved in cell wall biosynthesis